MIFKLYGANYHSVEPNFDSNALNEIAFRRDRSQDIPAEDFEAGYERTDEHEIAAKGEGDVQGEAEQRLLDDMLEEVDALLDGLGDDEVLVVESEQGKDWPKTRQEQKNVVVEGQNRLYFYVRVEPPLRLGVYRKVG